MVNLRKYNKVKELLGLAWEMDRKVTPENIHRMQELLGVLAYEVAQEECMLDNLQAAFPKLFKSKKPLEYVGIIHDTHEARTPCRTIGYQTYIEALEKARFISYQYYLKAGAIDIIQQYKGSSTADDILHRIFNDMGEEYEDAIHG